MEELPYSHFADLATKFADGVCEAKREEILDRATSAYYSAGYNLFLGAKYELALDPLKRSCHEFEKLLQLKPPSLQSFELKQKLFSRYKALMACSQNLKNHAVIRKERSEKMDLFFSFKPALKQNNPRSPSEPRSR